MGLKVEVMFLDELIDELRRVLEETPAESEWVAVSPILAEEDEWEDDEWEDDE